MFTLPFTLRFRVIFFLFRSIDVSIQQWKLDIQDIEIISFILREIKDKNFFLLRLESCYYEASYNPANFRNVQFRQFIMCLWMHKDCEINALKCFSHEHWFLECAELIVSLNVDWMNEKQTSNTCNCAYHRV